MSFSFNPRSIFILCAYIVATSVFLIFGFMLVMALPVFKLAGLSFFTTSTWDYATHQYGILDLIVCTLFLTVMTLIMVTPLGILTAVYLSDYAPPKIASALRSLIELLVGIPSVVFGIFGFLVLNEFFAVTLKPAIAGTLGFIPLFRNTSPDTGTGYLLAASVLTMMTLPTIVALSQESLRMVPYSYREGSFALGATKWETIRNVVIPAGMSGIITSVVLAAMRAMGETMAVVMLIGGAKHIPTSILDIGNTLTTKILIDSGYYLSLPESRSALFAIAITLFMMEVLFVAAIRLISNRFKENTVS